MHILAICFLLFLSQSCVVLAQKAKVFTEDLTKAGSLTDQALNHAAVNTAIKRLSASTDNTVTNKFSTLVEQGGGEPNLMRSPSFGSIHGRSSSSSSSSSAFTEQLTRKTEPHLQGGSQRSTVVAPAQSHTTTQIDTPQSDITRQADGLHPEGDPPPYDLGSGINPRASQENDAILSSGANSRLPDEPLPAYSGHDHSLPLYGDSVRSIMGREHRPPRTLMMKIKQDLQNMPKWQKVGMGTIAGLATVSAVGILGLVGYEVTKPDDSKDIRSST